MSKRRILIIDDEVSILEMLQRTLKNKFEVHVSNSGLGVEKIIEVTSPEAILLDIKMASISGFNILENIRKSPNGKKIPIIMVSALKERDVKIKALELGADDYITKPFDPEELIARLESKLNRLDQILISEPISKKYSIDNLIIHEDLHLVYIDENEIKLTKIEFDILTYIIKSKNQVITRSKLIEDIWGKDSGAERSLDTHIFSIRKKISKSTCQITTVYGEGFRLKSTNRLASENESKFSE